MKTPTETGNSATKTLKPSVGLAGVVMFGAGTAIGVSIFSVLQPAAQVAGTGLLLAMLISSLPMMVFAANYAFLGSALPVSGASYEWPRRFIHPFAGFMIAWLRIVGNVGAVVVLSTVLVNYLSMIFAVPPKITVAAAISLVFVLNLVGVSVAASVQTALMALLLAVLALFTITGLPPGHAVTMGPLLAKGWPAILAAVPLMISLFLGIESAVEIGEEVRSPQKTLPRGIVLAVLLTLVVYGAVAFTALGVAGPDTLAHSKAPLLEAARIPLGRAALPIIVGAACISILKSLNATALVFSRALFAMGRQGVLPSLFGQVHPRSGVPHAAILLAWALCMLGLFLPSDLIFLLLAVNIPTMLKYMACSISAANVARGHPEIASKAALTWKPATVQILGWLGALLAVGIILAGLEADTRPYLLLGGWAVLGVAYWCVRTFTTRKAAD